MNEIKATFSPQVSEYRTAVYFATSLRYQLFLKIFLAVAAVALLCQMAMSFGVIPTFMLPAYIFLGYLICIAFMCARLEHGIYKYSKSKDTVLFKEMSVTFAGGNMKVETPYNGKSFSLPLDRLFYVVELNNLFLIYIDYQQSILLPTRALSGRQRNEVRSLILNAIKDRFSTRYGYDNMLSKRSIFPKFR